MNYSLLDYANIATIVLAVGAVIAGIFAFLNFRAMNKNVDVLREQTRRNTFLSLMNQIADKRERENRARVMERLKEHTSVAILETWIKTGRAAERENRDDDSVMEAPPIGRLCAKDTKDMKNAIEETIACFDKVGYFLLGRDTEFINEAPEWIWEMTDKMWSRLGNYVLERQKSEPKWGKYFKELADIASKMSTKVKLNHDTQGGTNATG